LAQPVAELRRELDAGGAAADDDDLVQAAARRLHSCAGWSRHHPTYGAKISFAVEIEPPGRGPPAMTKMRPPTTAAPRPGRAVGKGGYALQVPPCGSYASTSLCVPRGASPPTTTTRPSKTTAAMPLRAVGSGARGSHRSVAGL